MQFWENFSKIVSWHPLLWEILDLPLIIYCSKYISDSINSTNSDQEEPPEEEGNKVWSRQQAAEILLGARFIKAKFSKELDEQLGLVNELVSKQMN